MPTPQDRPTRGADDGVQPRACTGAGIRLRLGGSFAGMRAALLTLVLMSTGCGGRITEVHAFADPTTEPPRHLYRAVVHATDGSAYVVRSWQVDGDMLKMEGQRYGLGRRVEFEGSMELSLADVVRMETVVAVRKEGGLSLLFLSAVFLLLVGSPAVAAEL